MTADGESWLELLRGAQAGDDDALSSLLARLYVRVTERMLRESSIRRQLAGETAEDIAAETIERVADAYARCAATSDVGRSEGRVAAIRVARLETQSRA